MQPAREAAARLVASGRIGVTQEGEVVDIETVRGPVRLRLRSEAQGRPRRAEGGDGPDL